MPIYGNSVGGAVTPNSYEIIGTDGTTLIAVATPSGNEEIMDATPNDVRSGKKFASGSGVLIGTKDIPAYRTTRGSEYIDVGEDFTIPLEDYDQYNYSEFMCIIAPFNNSTEDSCAADKISINNEVYPVQSNIKISDITKDMTNKGINLNMMNEATHPYVVHYFTYKEEL